MGTYINLGNRAFAVARNSEYVDKSGLIRFINGTISTSHMCSCVTRCRRFGKSMAAQMLNAYYDQSCDSRQLFADLEIAHDSSFEQHLNKYPVIYLDITNFTTRDIPRQQLVSEIDRRLKEELLLTYPDVKAKADDDLMDVLVAITNHYQQQFIMIIDEWDAICREVANDPVAMDKYVNLLRRLFKGGNTSNVFAAVYMTGILPIKKYNTQSALNNFWEYSMVTPRGLAPYFGFTKDEVRSLALRRGFDFEELEKWYDGYRLGNQASMFNPSSVIQALYADWCESYWASTGAYDAISAYIQMNFEGLKDDIIAMLGGGRCQVDPTTFQNDLSAIRSRDDVLTVLIHLGYLSYDQRLRECYIPNLEVAGEMEKAVKTTSWSQVGKALDTSRQLLRATLDGDEQTVARLVEATHDEETSILSYHNENSLACVLSIAYYYARNDYVIHREYPTGKGFADLVLIPRKNVESPAIVIELKFDDTADTALEQIRRRDYPAKVAQYADDLLLVGICYHRKTKQHVCRIERHHRH